MTSGGAQFVTSTVPQPVGALRNATLGTGIIDAPPGTVQGLQLVVPDIEVARAELVGHGIVVSEIQDFPWGRFVFFGDPDGNGWSVQQIPTSSPS